MVDQTYYCKVQCWVLIETREEFHRRFPWHGALSQTMITAIDKAIADDKQKKGEVTDGSGHATIGSVTSQVPETRPCGDDKGRRNGVDKPTQTVKPRCKEDSKKKAKR